MTHIAKLAHLDLAAEGAAAHAEPARLREMYDNPGDLRMLYYAPAELPAGAPLVVVLHGCGQSADAFAAGAGWLKLAEQHGFALLCPEQRRSNNINTCFNWFQPEDARRDSGEAASIAHMTRQILESRSLDPMRVFVAGLSAGGAMANVMLAAYPELYAGGAVIAGLPFAAASNVQEALLAMGRGVTRASDFLADAVRAASDHAGPWPRVTIWHGDQDNTVAPANAGAAVRQWADMHQLSAAAPVVEHLGARERTQWAGRDGAVVLELNIIRGLNHAWALASAGADGCGAPGPFLAESGVSTSAEILRFWGIHVEQRASADAKPAKSPRVARQALPAPNVRPLASEPSLAATPKTGPSRLLVQAFHFVFGKRP